MEDAPIINKVAKSGLITLDLEAYYPAGERVTYDIKDQLFHGQILREKDFRAHVKEHNWEQYQGKYVAVFCSADAIVPTWAYMLVAAQMAPYAKDIIFGSPENLNRSLLKKELDAIDSEQYKDAKVIIKGCGDLRLDAFAYVEITKKLQPHVASLMYGEPCSTVPVYKKKRALQK